MQHMKQKMLFYNTGLAPVRIHELQTNVEYFIITSSICTATGEMFKRHRVPGKCSLKISWHLPACNYV